MVCSICRLPGHNRRSCPQRSNITQISTGSRLSPRRPLLRNQSNYFIKKKWRIIINDVKLLRNFISRVVDTISLRCRNDNLEYIEDENDILIIYLSWYKAKCVIDSKLSNTSIIMMFLNSLMNNNISNNYYINSDNITQWVAIIQQARHKCFLYYQNHITDFPSPSQLINNLRTINVVNMRNENYLIYWVIGNYLIEDINERENSVKYIGFLTKKASFKIKTLNGHRFYLIPHRLDFEPPYHPKTDKEFIIEPFHELNIHEDIKEKVFIDQGENLSELNKWKFNALKLDYLIREIIKLGAKDNDVLECVLDLYDDIKLDSVTEIEKDVAGIPSTMTNIT